MSKCSSNADIQDSALALWHFLSVKVPNGRFTSAADGSTRTKPAVAFDPSEVFILDTRFLGSTDLGLGIVQLLEEKKLTRSLIFHAKDIYDN